MKVLCCFENATLTQMVMLTWSLDCILGIGVYLSSHLGELIGLGVDPAQWLQVCQVVMLWQARRQVHNLVVAPLRRHDDCSDLLHLQQKMRG